MEELITEALNTEQKRTLLEGLNKIFTEHAGEGIAIAFSGGVDSSLLLKAACDAVRKLNCNVLAVTFETKLHPHGDLEEAREAATGFGAVHKTITVDEFDDPEISHNPEDRCYRCKKLLFQTLIDFAHREGYYYLVDGSNYDDLNFYRPGMQALKELGIHSPLLSLKATKKQIRALAAGLGIAASDKPSAPCLATRLPYGTSLDYGLLARIDEGEKFIKSLGFYNVRLRLHQDILRIEIDQEDFSLLLAHRDRIMHKLKELEFIYLTLDLEGFRSGSMDIKIHKS